MALFLIIVGVFVMYWRCLNYYFIIDDIVRRWGYLYEVPETSPPPEFYSTKPHKWRHLWPIICHALNVWVVYLIWGICPAVLFAFAPLSVPGTAWITGSYYAVTTLFTLTSYFFLVAYPNFIGAGLSALFFTVALGSTITCIGFPFLFAFFHPWGLINFWPLAFYLKGRRFTKGFAIRDMGKQDHFHVGKLAVMTKVIAFYIYMVVFPYRLAFFRRFGEDYVKDEGVKKDLNSFNGWFWFSLASIALFTFIGWQFSPIGTLWFLFMIAPFSQFKVLGQFIAERYVYLPSIGWYVILGTALLPYPIVLWGVVALYALRTHFYIPAYEKIESLYEEGIKNDPKCLANYANLGERYIHTGRLQEGRDVLQKGIDIDPDNFLCYTNMAAYWVQIRDLQKGLYYTEKSVEFGRKKSSWFIFRAMQDQYRNLKEHELKVMNYLYFGEQLKSIIKENKNAVAVG